MEIFYCVKIQYIKELIYNFPILLLIAIKLEQITKIRVFLTTYIKKKIGPLKKTMNFRAFDNA